MVPPLSEVVHKEPQQVALVHVRVVQAVLVTLPLVLLDHLEEAEGEQDHYEAATKHVSPRGQLLLFVTGPF